MNDTLQYVLDHFQVAEKEHLYDIVIERGCKLLTLRKPRTDDEKVFVEELRQVFLGLFIKEQIGVDYDEQLNARFYWKL